MFKRNRRLSSELHSRFGDPSISYPNEGSWNQNDHTPNYIPGTATDAQGRDCSDSSRRSLATGTRSSQHRGSSSDRGHAASMQNSGQFHSSIPRGYYDDRIRHRSRRARSSDTRDLDLERTRHGYNGGHGTPVDDESCDEEDEELDTFNSGQATAFGYNDHCSRVMLQFSHEEHDSAFDNSPRSPPLSVTSRMRRDSIQSATTDHSASMTGTTSSRHTSYTGASSVSASSRSHDIPRYAFTNMHTGRREKRATSRPKYREPEPAVRQEMVPSYDELYG